MSARWRLGSVLALVAVFGWLSVANFIPKDQRLESDWLPDDGLRLVLDDGFLLLRLSGTEPLLRVYAEAPGARRLRRRLEAGAALLPRGSLSPGSR